MPTIESPAEEYDLEKILEQLDQNGQVADFNDMKSIHQQIESVRIALFKTMRAQSETERELAIAEQKYKRAWNRMYISEIGSDALRKATAEIKTESLNNDLISRQVTSKELQRRTQYYRQELRVLESLSNDYRQMIRSQQ